MMVTLAGQTTGIHQEALLKKFFLNTYVANTMHLFDDSFIIKLRNMRESKKMESYFPILLG